MYVCVCVSDFGSLLCFVPVLDGSVQEGFTFYKSIHLGSVLSDILSSSSSCI